MPGWHEGTLALQQQGRVRMVGIIQEQHPDRARLFMQWKQMDWPILVDSLDLLGVSVVPITLAIDEHGIIRAVNPRLERIEAEFVDRTYEAPLRTANAGSSPGAGVPETPASSSSPATWRAYADALYRWAPARRSDAIEAYRQAVAAAPGDGVTHFRLGVAYRARYDSDERQADDFRLAVEHWEQSLAIDPNHYIRRRRIQQYGPRLDKPYPFYDWVPTARREIASRGAEPAPLRVEPGGAEFAAPATAFEAERATPAEPDPDGRIYRDRGEFVITERLTVPTVVAPGQPTRVHLVFRPNLDRRAHWNNEVDDLMFWVRPPAGWEVDQRQLTVPRPPVVVSQEPRQIEFELRSPNDAVAGETAIPGYALYYVCEDVDGTCLYRRQDVVLTVTVR